jgi:hypothetical protein
MSSAAVEFGLTALAAMCNPTSLTFSVLVLVVSDRPGRTGGWFFAGAFSATLLVGVLAAIVLGGAAAPARGSSSPPTWVSIVDLVLAALLVAYVIRAMRRPPDPKRISDAVTKMTSVAASPPLLIAAAGATLANPGAFLAIAVKNVSQLNPSPAVYAVLWIGFATVALLPLLTALVALRFDHDRTTARLAVARRWLEGNVRTIAAVIVLLLAVALTRNGIAGLT